MWSGGTDYSGWDDRDLLLAAKSQRDAFAEFYSRHVEGVLRYFARAVGQSDVAFDLTAETFAAALRALPDYRATAAPGKSWLYAIAHHRLVDAVRHGNADARAREELGMHAIVLDDQGEAMIESIIDRVDGRSALELVRDLPSNERHAITARFLRDKDYAEIAAEMRCSEQVVRKRVSRGLTRLRNLYRSAYGG